MSESLIVMRWPELGKQVRVQPVEHNREAFDWFVDNLPLKCLQGHTVVAGFALFMLNLGLRKTFPWREEDLVAENIVEMPQGRFTFFMTTGKVANLSCKWGEMTESMSYVTWAEVVEEDKPTLVEVGEKMWDIFMGNEKEIVHAEFIKVED